jgi:magnesium-transporting ATPase (P-type)
MWSLAFCLNRRNDFSLYSAKAEINKLIGSTHLLIKEDETVSGHETEQTKDFDNIIAMPDLVVGMIGIPVAFALQNLVEEATAKEIQGFFTAPALGCFIFFILFYGFYSIALLAIFETGGKKYLHEDLGKKTNSEIKPHDHLAVVFQVLSTVFVVAAVFLSGRTYQSGEIQQLPIWACLLGLLAIHIVPITFGWWRENTKGAFFKRSPRLLTVYILALVFFFSVTFVWLLEVFPLA